MIHSKSVRMTIHKFIDLETPTFERDRVVDVRSTLFPLQTGMYTVNNTQSFVYTVSLWELK